MSININHKKHNLNIHERIKCFHTIFSHTNDKTDEHIALNINVNKLVLTNLYSVLCSCVRDKNIPNKNLLKLMNTIWKRYNNDYKNFNVHDLDKDAIIAYKKLKNKK